MTEHPVPPTDSPDAGAQAGLQTGAVTLSGVLMQAVTHIGPAVGIIFAVPAIAGLAGVASPWAFFAGGILMLLVAVSVVELAKRLSSAGGYFSWVSHILGPRTGFMTAWLFFLYSPIAAGINLAFMGGILQATLKAQYGFNLEWWIPCLLGTALVAVLQYRGLKVSIRTVVALGAAEMLLCLALAVFGLVSPGDGGLNLTPFDPTRAPSVNGFYLAIVFSVFTFTGFESVAPLAEESENPLRNLPRAVLMSLAIAIAFFLIVPWGILVGWGTDDVGGFVSNGSPVFALAHRLWGGAWVLILLAFVNSIIAVALAGSNAGTRVFFGMARAGALPRTLARVHPVHRTPTNAVLLQTLITVALTVGGGIVLGPVQTLVYFAIPLTLATILVYCAGNIAVWRLYRTEQRAHFNALRHLIIPVASSAALIWVGYKTLFPLPTGTAHTAPLVFVGWVVLGILVTVTAIRMRGSGWLSRAGRAAIADEDEILEERLGLGTPAASVGERR